MSALQIAPHIKLEIIFPVNPAISGKYKKYVKFTFDSSGEVKKWDSKRVDYTKTGPNKKATALAIGITLVVLGLIVYSFSQMAFMP